MKFENFDQLVSEAESTFKKGLGTLGTWGEEALDLLQTKPGVVLAAAGISGLVAGTLIRRMIDDRRARAKRSASRNTSSSSMIPELALLVGGVAAGVLVGPELLEQAARAIQGAVYPTAAPPADSNDELAEISSISSMEGARIRTPSSMNERPFEKS